MVNPLLGEGRTLYTDNYYTSVDLAKDLLAKKTHLIGTLRKKRKYNPKPVVTAKLKKGEMTKLQSESKIIVGKWKDKRDVLFLTTKSVPELTNITNKRGKVVTKPSTVIDYNSAKGFIDISDQLASYNSPVRKSIKWYRKVAMELITNTTVVNAFIAFTKLENKRIDITKFREEIVLGLEEIANANRQLPNVVQDVAHKIVTINKRSRCVLCYENFVKRYGRGHAVKYTKQIKTACQGCDVNVNICTECFFEKHLVTLKK